MKRILTKGQSLGYLPTRLRMSLCSGNACNGNIPKFLSYNSSVWGHIPCEVPQVRVSQDQLKVNLLWNINTTPGLHSDSLRTGWSRDRIPVEARFSTSVQTKPGTHPASCKMGTGSFQEVKRPGRGFDHPLPNSAKVEERVGLNLYSPSGPSWPVLG